MGSSDPNADKIKKMKLAFETSINDKLNVSAILEAAEKDLHNMSLNFSILEKSIVSQAAEASRRFTIAPDAEGNINFRDAHKSIFSRCRLIFSSQCLV